MRSASTDSEPSRSRRRSWVLFGLIGVAQAAAVLVAGGLAWHRFTTSSSPQIPQTIAADSSAPSMQPVAWDGTQLSMAPVEVEEGSLVVIVIPGAGEKPTIVDRTPEWMFFGVDDWYLVYNVVEALASPVVAMKE